MPIPPEGRLLDEDFVPGDDGEEMESERGCGGKYYKRGCHCEDCADRGDWEYEQRRDKEILEEFYREEMKRREEE